MNFGKARHPLTTLNCHFALFVYTLFEYFNPLGCGKRFRRHHELLKQLFWRGYSPPEFRINDVGTAIAQTS